MPQPPVYSYQTCDPNCPECGNDLTDDKGIVVHSTHRKSFRTNLGKEHPFSGFVMDPKAKDSTLITRDPDLTVQCGGCYTYIEVEVK